MKINISNTILYILAAVPLTTIIFLFYSLIDFCISANKVREQQIKDCEALNPKYGVEYTAKSGFYLNVPMKAITVKQTTVGLLPNNLEGTPIDFLCADIVESNLPNMEL